MFSAKSLSDDQISTIKAWAESGDVLADIQRKMNDDMEIKVTYLETRFMLEDLKIELLPEPEPEPEEEDSTEEASPEAEDGEAADDPADEKIPTEDEAVVSIDKIQKPGALISGKVTFAGGLTTPWWLDQMGQLGMEPFDEDFKPSEAQLMSFQKELQAAIQKSGL